MNEQRDAAIRIHTSLAWHRRDLRLHDNEIYHKVPHRIVSLYVINPADYQPRPCGAQTTLETVTVGPHASRALVHALTNLRQNLRLRGGDLVIRRGDPLLVIPEFVREINADSIVWSQEPGSYEQRISHELAKLLRPTTCVHTVMGYTLHHPDDLPRDEETWNALARPKEKRKKRPEAHDFDTTKTVSQEPDSGPHTLVNVSTKRLTGLPRIMGDFRRAARTAASVRPCLDAPTAETLLSINGLDPGELPTLQELTAAYKKRSLFGLPSTVISNIVDCAQDRMDSDCTGGETFAIEQLYDFVQHHAATANRSLADVSNHQSAHTSTALATGALSARQIYWRAIAEPGCEWLVSHMEMRDYFIYTTLAADHHMFRLRGQKLPAKLQEWKAVQDHMESFTRWALGETKLPLVDAGMRELTQTGYCSNRVRQNMASVLAKDLQLDWRVGAEWFQFCLQDHCVAANWGNWQYFGGVGNDPKNRHFRTVSQAIRYDPDGQYVQKWLPALEAVAARETLYRPWVFLSDWDNPIVDPATQLTWQDGQRLEEAGNLLVGDDGTE